MWLWPRSEPDRLLRFQHTTELQGLPVTGTTGSSLLLLEFYNLSLKHSWELQDALLGQRGDTDIEAAH